MKVCFSLLFLCISLGLNAQEKRHLVDVTASRFLIQGKTNVNEFNCELYQEASEHDLNVKSQWSDYQLKFNGLKFQYPIREFDCGIDAMNNDLQDLVNSDDHPYLHLEIHSININRGNEQIERLMVSARVSITLSGETRSYTISDGTVINKSDHELTFVGKKTLKMSDFGITPPSKFFGLVVVTDELKVAFSIDMQIESY